MQTTVARRDSTVGGLDTRPTGDDLTPVDSPAPSKNITWPHLFACAATSTILLNLSFAPVNLFFCAWIALVPWLWALHRIGTGWRAAAFGGVTGALFYASAMTWLWHATWLGTTVLLAYLGIFWMAVGWLIANCRLPIANWKIESQLAIGNWQLAISALATAAAFTSIEWLRGWLFTGFPWLNLSQTQTPFLPICQIADVTGHYGVTFWVVLCNATIALLIIHRHAWHRVIPAACGFAVITCLLIGYGIYRISQTQSEPGPTLLLVQSNFPHARGGAKTVTPEMLETYHFARTEQALAGKSVDLIAWSETVLPAMNIEARRSTRNPRLSTGIHDDLLALSRRHNAAIVFGAYALLKFPKASPGQDPRLAERNADVRNSTYLYDHRRPDQPRYDKIHLVPMGEIVPFRGSIPWLHDLFFQLAAYSVNYVITPGSVERMTVFDMPAAEGKTYRFVTPICFEDIDAALVGKMFRPSAGDRRKRADFILNISNHGWFNGQMRHQHLQNAIFRSIENRVWTARCSNTGISGFIDSTGRLVETIASGTEGVAIRKIGIDPRVSVFTRWGDWFGWTCLLFAGAGILWARVK